MVTAETGLSAASSIEELIEALPSDGVAVLYADDPHVTKALARLRCRGKTPLTFSIEANSLKEAMEVFPKAVNKAVEEVVELSIPRLSSGSLPGEVDDTVRTARDILTALTDHDPQSALRALRLRLEIYDRVNALGIGAQGLGGLLDDLHSNIGITQTGAEAVRQRSAAAQ